MLLTNLMSMLLTKLSLLADVRYSADEEVGAFKGEGLFFFQLLFGGGLFLLKKGTNQHGDGWYTLG
jgi:hypothetical protein